MKKLYSLTALGALLYATPAHACMFLGVLFHFNLTPVISLPIALFLIAQALLLRNENHEISYSKALLMACVGNIPSTIIGYFPLTWQLLDQVGIWQLLGTTGLILFPIIDITLTSITISRIFRYPMERIVPPIIASAVIFYVIAIIWMRFNAPGLHITSCCGH